MISRLNIFASPRLLALAVVIVVGLTGLAGYATYQRLAGSTVPEAVTQTHSDNAVTNDGNDVSTEPSKDKASEPKKAKPKESPPTNEEPTSEPNEPVSDPEPKPAPKPKPPDPPDEEPSSPPSTKPSSANTGPRYSLTRTMTSSEAEAELRSTGYLSRVHITNGILDLESGWVLEDIRLSGSGLYMVRAFTSSGAPAVKPIIRYAEISGGSTSACVYIRWTIIEYSDVSSCIDLFKLGSGAVVRYSYGHDLFGVDGGHHDNVQIVSGTDILVEWNNFVGKVTLGNAAGAPRNTSGVLQTGALNGNLINVRWLDNWVTGGHYTLRGVGSTADESSYTVDDYIFRRNKHGRDFTYGPYAAMGPRTSYDSSNVWEDTGEPVRP